MHLKNLKPSPVASPLVDACIECGFCESNCPSRDVTLTPRQRITSFREMTRLEGLDSRNGAEDERCAGAQRATKLRQCRFVRCILPASCIQRITGTDDNLPLDPA